MKKELVPFAFSGNRIVAPIVRPIVYAITKLYDTVDWAASPSSLLPRSFSLTRASTGTYFDSAGLLQTAAINAARGTYRYPTTAPGGGQWGQLPGTSGSYFSTPDSVTNSITGDIDIRVQCSLPDWTPASETTLVAKYVLGGQGAWDFAVVGSSSGNLVLYTSPDGTTARTHSSTVATGITDGAIKWLRATRSASTGVVNFYLSDDGETWTALGTPVAGTVEGIFNSTAGVEVGAINNGNTTYATGNFYAAKVYNGIDGTLAVNFDADDYASGTTWTASTTGETWTVNGSASIAWPWVFDGTIVEAAATNLAIRSTAMANAAWATNFTTVTADQSVYLDGTTTMAALTPNAVLGLVSPFFYEYNAAGITITANTEYCVSVDVKRKAGTMGLRVWWVDSGFGSGVRADFDLTGIAASTVTTVGTGSSTGTPRIENMGSGIYRVSLSGKVDAVSVAGFFVVEATKAYQDGTVYTPNGTDGFFVSGAQVELGNAPTSRIPTAAGSVPRAADVLTAPTSGLLVNGQGFAAIGFRPITAPTTGNIIAATNLPISLNAGQLSLNDGTAARDFLAATLTVGTSAKLATTWGNAVCNGAFNGTVGTQRVFDTDMGLGATITLMGGTPGVLQFLRLGTYSLSPGELKLQTS
jgi:hypothetical protein